ncbi:DNA polymerase III subunit gamma/tau [Stutzerimonas stutzeri]|jgi:DNA polymerase III subunit gamma/tau|uniref:DNA polymerase III subunit gamma/tau n=1 Tax=Stutzerimonas stutzeri TaxID=316 RepID=UPI0005F26B56|nr:DNA polymerase III subunit gamma/tau [Stutzerimonas stutzeri]MPS59680.1 DNA polymerase III subunit gamma/tau [Pseudomonas sp.]NMY62719.1 DNA polymerase III subunit gamma/tau [Pseudomonas sp. WS 5018]OWG39710.1 DNA polymerase III subunit gamma/tau [Stutzerimonas stutzeri]RRV39736.1 DNA polymerase III subunit gamma/tau [Stutzerimonas stutzeri]GLZ23452.1 DNA polymerase III subunit gamma/tau [Stutzerimonas stutzeri]
MSYQVLARKWRPRSFREMVGQTHVLKALINALDNQRLHHAYLFTGTRGVGKTTIARIIAKCLNCETGVSSTPCGQCSVCREIDEGRFVDLIEVDAASRTKVEDTRELLDNVQYAPSRGRYKVYLIDEVHMLSSHSFNALLKTLEEPPPHVKFLLATTDPQKLPVTILSRCLQFSLKNMPPERVVEHLTHVLGVENVPFEEDALWLLGRAADGSMRDAMSLTDQAIAFGEGKVLAADVRAMLGTLDHGQVYGVLQALLEGDARALLEAVRHLAEQGPDWAGVLAEMLNVLHRVAIAQALPEAVDNGQGDRDRVLALAQALPAEDVQFYYQMGLIGRRDLPLAPDPRSGFEMVLLRMLAFRPADTGDAPRTSLKNLGISPATADSKPAAVANTAAPGVSPVSAPAPVAPAAAVAPAPVVIASPAESAATVAPELPAVATSPAAPTQEQAVPVIDVPWNEPPEVPPVAVEANAILPEPALDGPPDHVAAVVQVEEPDDDEPPLTDEDYFEVENQAEAYFEELQQDETDQQEVEPLPAVEPATGLAAEWLELYLKLGLSGLTGSIAANCTLISVEGDRWLMHLDPAQSALFNPTQQRRLNDALNQYHGRTLQLDIVLQKPEQETPAQAAQRRRAERQRAAEQSIHADPLVQQLMQQFAAVIREGTIEPVEHSEP